MAGGEILDSEVLVLEWDFKSISCTSKSFLVSFRSGSLSKISEMRINEEESINQ